MSKMIQLRNVPDTLHRKLKSRAALEGLSLSEYLIGEARRSAERPTLIEFRQRLAQRTPETPDVAPAEAVRAERDAPWSPSAAGKLTAERGLEALADLADFPLHRYAHDWLLPRMWELRHNVTVYDAAYLTLAEALPAPLVSCDARLASAPGHAARIEVF